MAVLAADCVPVALADPSSGRPFVIPELAVDDGPGEMLPHTIDIAQPRLLHPLEILVQLRARPSRGLAVAAAVLGIGWRLDNPLTLELRRGQLPIALA
jgi:hypothetical protein